MAVETGVLSLAQSQAAAMRIQRHILATPIISGDALAGNAAWLKPENLQRTGSFKIRGATNAVLQLDPEQRRRGVITLSAGNHGQALPSAARAAGAPSVAFVPASDHLNTLHSTRPHASSACPVPSAALRPQPASDPE